MKHEPQLSSTIHVRRRTIVTLTEEKFRKSKFFKRRKKKIVLFFFIPQCDHKLISYRQQFICRVIVRLIVLILSCPVFIISCGFVYVHVRSCWSPKLNLQSNLNTCPVLAGQGCALKWTRRRSSTRINTLIQSCPAIHPLINIFCQRLKADSRQWSVTAATSKTIQAMRASIVNAAFHWRNVISGANSKNSPTK